MTDTEDDGYEEPPKPREHVDPMRSLNRAVQRVGGDFFAAWRRTMSGDAAAEARGMVEMLVLTIRSNEAAVPEYLALPAHLPDDEKQQRSLSISTVKADADLKADLYSWARENKLRQDRASKALEVLVQSYRKAEFITSDPDCEDSELVDWMTVINGHARLHFGVDVGEAPIEKADIEAWSWRVAGERNPSPAWLTTGDVAGAGLFEPQRVRRGGGPRPFTTGANDDD